jgi:hypothetical protein
MKLLITGGSVGIGLALKSQVSKGLVARRVANNPQYLPARGMPFENLDMGWFHQALKRANVVGVARVTQNSPHLRRAVVRVLRIYRRARVDQREGRL